MKLYGGGTLSSSCFTSNSLKYLTYIEAFCRQILLTDPDKPIPCFSFPCHNGYLMDETEINAQKSGSGQLKDC